MKYILGVLALVGFFWFGIGAHLYYEHHFQPPLEVVYIKGQDGENGLLVVMPNSKMITKMNVPIELVKEMAQLSTYGAFVVKYDCSEPHDGTAIDDSDGLRYRVF